MKKADQEIIGILQDIQAGGGEAGGAAYLVYTAQLTQSSTDAPVEATVYENTIGAIVWSYSAEGAYAGVLVGAFPVNKVPTLWSAKNIAGGGAMIGHRISRQDDDTALLEVFRNDALVDGFLSAVIEIRVYQP